MVTVEGRRPKKLLRFGYLARGLWITVPMAWSLISCARGVRPACDHPPPFYVVIQTSDRLNPNADQRSLTTEVELLQLKALGRFENAGFDDIWQRGKEVLGEDLVQIDQRFIDPGSSTVFGLRRDAKANYVAVVANFRNYAGTEWRSVTRLPLPREDSCTPQPADVKPAPGKDDTQLKFFLEQYKVENRTPPERSSAPTSSTPRGRA